MPNRQLTHSYTVELFIASLHETALSTCQMKALVRQILDASESKSIVRFILFCGDLMGFHLAGKLNRPLQCIHYKDIWHSGQHLFWCGGENHEEIP